MTVVRVHELSARSPQLWGDRYAVGVAGKNGEAYDPFGFTAFPQWCKQQRGRPREGGREEREERADAAAAARKK